MAIRNCREARMTLPQYSTPSESPPPPCCPRGASSSSRLVSQSQDRLRAKKSTHVPDPRSSAIPAAKSAHFGLNAERRYRNRPDPERAVRAPCREVESQARDTQSPRRYAGLRLNADIG